jgi:predicted nucleotidyltransferase
MRDLLLPLSVRRIVDRYKHAFAPEKIILFGSYAKETNKQGSDIDLLIVINTTYDISTCLRRAHQLAVDCFPPVDVVFATKEDIETATITNKPFLSSILDLGITIYERDQSN